MLGHYQGEKIEMSVYIYIYIYMFVFNNFYQTLCKLTYLIAAIEWLWLTFHALTGPLKFLFYLSFPSLVWQATVKTPDVRENADIRKKLLILTQRVISLESRSSFQMHCLILEYLPILQELQLLCLPPFETGEFMLHWLKMTTISVDVRDRGIAPPTLNLGIRWRRRVGFTSRPL